LLVDPNRLSGQYIQDGQVKVIAYLGQRTQFR